MIYKEEKGIYFKKLCFDYERRLFGNMKKSKVVFLLVSFVLLLSSATAEASQASRVSTKGTVALFIGVAVLTLVIKYLMES